MYNKIFNKACSNVLHQLNQTYNFSIHRKVYCTIQFDMKFSDKKACKKQVEAWIAGRDANQNLCRSICRTAIIYETCEEGVYTLGH